ncbi:MAG: hypothetical protein ACRD3V_17755 [Vicinamibacteria bacterium]
MFPIAAFLGSRAGAESPLDRVLEAHGGLERFRAVRDWRIVAERNLDGSETPNEIYEEYLLRDGTLERTLLIKKREGSVLVFGHDGRRGFALTDGKLREDEGASSEGYYRAHGEYYLRAIPFKWVDPGVRVTSAGSETIEGRKLDLFRVTADENVGRAWKDVWVAAVDAETHRLWEARLTHHRGTEAWMDPKEKGTTEIVYRYTDYRDVGGLQVPHRLEYYSGGRKTGENVIRTMEVDSGLKSDAFRPDYWQERASGERYPRRR